MIRDNPLLAPERYGRTYADCVRELLARSRLPDPQAIAEVERALALQELIRAREPGRWAREVISRTLPPRRRGPKAKYTAAEHAALAQQIRPYVGSDKEAGREARERLGRPRNPTVVRQLVELAQFLTTSSEQARAWVAEALGLSEDRIKKICQGRNS